MTDPTDPHEPLDGLRLPAVPIDPRPAFAADLRGRLTAALATDRGGAMSSTTTTTATTTNPATTTSSATSYRPAGSPTLSPALSMRNARAAIQFYKDAFGAVDEGPALIGPDGTVGHAELRIGDSVFSVAEEWPYEGLLSPTAAGGTTVQLSIYVPDCDAVFARAVELGARVWREPELAPYGARSAKVQDPFGHNWFIQTQVQDLTGEEFAANFAEDGYVVEDLSDPDPDSGPEPDPAIDTVDLGDRAEGTAPGAVPAASAADRRGQLFYFTFSSTDIAASHAFFAELLGWELEENNPGSYHIANIPAPGGIYGDDEAKSSIYFVVADIFVAAEQARSLGAEVDEPILYESGWSVRCVDPGGVEFWLSVPAAGY